MSKQTAVEWLIEQLKKQKDILQNHFEQGKWNDDRCSEIDNCILLCEQAKQMEKDQIVDALCDGRLSVINKNIISSEQYFNETFKQ
jgi:hypothetical protein